MALLAHIAFAEGLCEAHAGTVILTLEPNRLVRRVASGAFHPLMRGVAQGFALAVVESACWPPADTAVVILHSEIARGADVAVVAHFGPSTGAADPTVIRRAVFPVAGLALDAFQGPGAVRSGHRLAQMVQLGSRRIKPRGMAPAAGVSQGACRITEPGGEHEATATSVEPTINIFDLIPGHSFGKSRKGHTPGKQIGWRLLACRTHEHPRVPVQFVCVILVRMADATRLIAHIGQGGARAACQKLTHHEPAPWEVSQRHHRVLPCSSRRCAARMAERAAGRTSRLGSPGQNAPACEGPAW